LHGVVFDILVGSENHVGSAVPVPQPGAVRAYVVNGMEIAATLT